MSELSIEVKGQQFEIDTARADGDENGRWLVTVHASRAAPELYSFLRASFAPERLRLAVFGPNGRHFELAPVVVSLVDPETAVPLAGLTIQFRSPE